MANPTPLSFHTVSGLVSCGIGSIAWDVNSNGDATFPLMVTNINVPQSPDTIVSPPRLKIRQKVTLQQVNETLDAQTDPLSGGFTWNTVNVPQAWYQLEAYTPLGIVTSNVFLVVNGTDVSCLTASIPSSSSSTPAPSSTPSTTPSTDPTDTSSTTPAPTGAISISKSKHAGAIAGGVVGGLAFLLAVIAMLFFWRRRSSRQPELRKWKAAPIGGKKDRVRSFHHGSTESTGAILSRTTSPRQSDLPMKMPMSTPSSEEDIATGLEKGILYADPVQPSVRHQPESTTSSLRSQRQRSFSTSAAYETIESGVPFPEPSAPAGGRRSIDRRSMDSTLFFQPHRQSSTSIVMSPISPGPQNIDRHSRRASRKPVPLYNAAEFNASNSTSSGDVGAERPRVHPTRSQSSFGTGEGGERPVHYLIPDVPPPQKIK